MTDQTEDVTRTIHKQSSKSKPSVESCISPFRRHKPKNPMTPSSRKDRLFRYVSPRKGPSIEQIETMIFKNLYDHKHFNILFANRNRSHLVDGLDNNNKNKKFSHQMNSIMFGNRPNLYSQPKSKQREKEKEYYLSTSPSRDGSIKVAKERSQSVSQEHYTTSLLKQLKERKAREADIDYEILRNSLAEVNKKLKPVNAASRAINLVKDAKQMKLDPSQFPPILQKVMQLKLPLSPASFEDIKNLSPPRNYERMKQSLDVQFKKTPFLEKEKSEFKSSPSIHINPYSESKELREEEEGRSSIAKKGRFQELKDQMASNFRTNDSRSNRKPFTTNNSIISLNISINGVHHKRRSLASRRNTQSRAREDSHSKPTPNLHSPPKTVLATQRKAKEIVLKEVGGKNNDSQKKIKSELRGKSVHEENKRKVISQDFFKRKNPKEPEEQKKYINPHRVIASVTQFDSSKYKSFISEHPYRSKTTNKVQNQGDLSLLLHSPGGKPLLKELDYSCIKLDSQHSPQHSPSIFEQSQRTGTAPAAKGRFPLVQDQRMSPKQSIKSHPPKNTPSKETSMAASRERPYSGIYSHKKHSNTGMSPYLSYRESSKERIYESSIPNKNRKTHKINNNPDDQYSDCDTARRTVKKTNPINKSIEKNKASNYNKITEETFQSQTFSNETAEYQTLTKPTSAKASSSSRPKSVSPSKSKSAGLSKIIQSVKPPNEGFSEQKRTTKNFDYLQTQIRKKENSICLGNFIEQCGENLNYTKIANDLNNLNNESRNLSDALNKMIEKNANALNTRSMKSLNDIMQANEKTEKRKTKNAKEMMHEGEKCTMYILSMGKRKIWHPDKFYPPKTVKLETSAHLE